MKYWLYVFITYMVLGIILTIVTLTGLLVKLFITYGLYGILLLLGVIILFMILTEK